MKVSNWMMVLLCAFLQLHAGAQIPKNDQKEFEYAGEATVKRAGSGELVERFAYWANGYFNTATSLEVLVDDSTKKVVEVKVTEALVESYFGVNRLHKDRSLSYYIRFDADRKDFTYKLNAIRYRALESDPKGRETQHDVLLSDFKSPASKSLEEEVNNRLSAVVASFMLAAEEPVPVE